MKNLVAACRLELTTINALTMLMHSYRRDDLDYLCETFRLCLVVLLERR